MIQKRDDTEAARPLHLLHIHPRERDREGLGREGGREGE
jgi:hypothetical protein